MKRVRTILAAAALLLAPAALAAGLVGTWTLTGEGRDGPTTSELTVTEADGGYAGTVTGQRGTAELQSITVDGDSFSFVITMQTRMGDLDLTYSGTVSGDTLTASIETPMGSRPVTGVRKQ